MSPIEILLQMTGRRRGDAFTYTEIVVFCKRNLPLSKNGLGFTPVRIHKAFGNPSRSFREIPSPAQRLWKKWPKCSTNAAGPEVHLEATATPMAAPPPDFTADLTDASACLQLSTDRSCVTDWALDSE